MEIRSEYSRFRLDMNTDDKFYELYNFCPQCGNQLSQENDHLACKACHHNWYNNPAISVSIALIKNGKILLAKRAVEPKKGKWDILGGFVEPGESVEQGVIREMKEETGLNVKVDEYLGSVPDIYDNRASLPLIFRVSLINEAQPVAQDDVEELRWFSLTEIPTELAFVNVKETIEKVKKDLN